MSLSRKAEGGSGGRVALALAAWCSAAVVFFWRQGWLLYYGDAEAHLNIARRLFDSQIPGYKQIGTVWLPLPHALIAPFARVDSLWFSGLAGAIPSAACMFMAGCFLYFAALRIFASKGAALTATALLVLNPNMMYVGSTAMTEAYFLACLTGLLYFSVRFRDTQGLGAVMGAGIAACMGTLTRYEGWFLLPFAAAYFLFTAKRNKLGTALVFGIIAGMGPLYWLFHNWWLTGDALDFFRGPYSARAIQGGRPYPGKGDWRLAALYYGSAVRLCAGTALAIAGLLGTVVLLARRAVWPLALLALPPLFYVWSVHSSGTPIFAPELWPNSFYNTRYGLAALPLLALAAGALVAAVPPGVRKFAAVLVIVAGAGWWAAYHKPADWVTWAESKANSEGRRAWTREASGYLSSRFVRGSGLVASSGEDFSGIFREMRLPLREVFGVCNDLEWTAATQRPDLYVWHEWLVVKSDDPVLAAIKRRGAPRYKLEFEIRENKEPVVQVYRRIGGVHGGA